MRRELRVNSKFTVQLMLHEVWVGSELWNPDRE
jgi:hypothetical protein